MRTKKLIINSGKTKQQYYNNLNHRKVTDNKSFWRYTKPLFSDKSSISNKIKLVEKDFVLEKNDDIAEIFNDFFTSVVSNLNILRYQDPLLIVTKLRTELGTLF